MNILETERLMFRELNAATDSAFVLELLNSPKFLKYIGDRGVGTIEESAAFIENRYRQSYSDHGFGLYAVETKDSGSTLGVCGFVKRDTLPGPDLGFAFLPDHEGKGYGLESADAMMRYGHETLGFTTVWAITSLNNDASGRLLNKLGFTFDQEIESGGETLKLFVSNK